jgi:hypothetical protein
LTDYATQAGAKGSIAGMVSTSGITNITISAQGQTTIVLQGMSAFDSSGALVANLTDSSPYPVTITLNTSGKPLIFAGSYSGTSTGADGNVITFPLLTISPTGIVNATIPGSSGGTVTGSIGPTGIVTYTVKPTGGKTYTGIGYFGFDETGALWGYDYDEGGMSILSLTRSSSGEAPR